MKDINKKQVYLLVLGLLVIVFTVAGVSFALFTFSRLGDTSTTIQSGDIEFSFIEGEEVTLENAFPVSDAIGAADTTYIYKFDVKMSSSSDANTAVYNVSLLTDNTGDNHFKNSEVKFNLMKGDEYVVGSADKGELLSSIEGFDETSTSGIGAVLTDQSIASKTVDSYKLRIWIDENVNYSGDIDSNGTMTGTKNSYTYTLKVKVTATATNGTVASVPAEQVEYSNSTYTTCTDISCSLNELYAGQ